MNNQDRSDPTKRIGSNHHERILVVEDHDDTAELLNTVLGDEGYIVTRVSNAVMAFDILSRDCHVAARCPHLVLLDLTMEGRDPVDMVSEMDVAAMPPVLVVSAKPEAMVRQAAEKIHAAGIVRKPFDIEELLATVRRALNYAPA